LLATSAATTGPGPRANRRNHEAREDLALIALVAPPAVADADVGSRRRTPRRYGGEGRDGDDGVRGAGAIFGGVIYGRLYR
jgi:hypothetical protein